MLLEVFRPDDPVLQVVMPPENRQELEEKLAQLPTEIFIAEDSLGWVYQFWQRNAKTNVNQSEVKIGANELAPVTQLFTEDYMVPFSLGKHSRRLVDRTTWIDCAAGLQLDISPPKGGRYSCCWYVRRLAKDGERAAHSRPLHGQRAFSLVCSADSCEDARR